MSNKDSILLNKAIAKEYLELAKSLDKNQRFADEVIELLVSGIKNKKLLYIRSIIAETFGYLTMHPELFPILEEIFLEKEKHIEGEYTESLNFVVGKSLLEFTNKKIEVKEILLYALRDSLYEMVRITATNLLGTHFQDDAKELIPIFKKIIREDKSQKVRIQAWQRFVGLGNRVEVKTEQEILKREIAYLALFKVLEKVQPGLQISIDRIIELSDKFYYEKAEEMRYFGIELIKYPEEIYIDLIKEIIENKNLNGKYFDFEQVFVRGDEKTPSITPTALSKEYLCYNCGNIIEKETNNCPDCEKDIPKSMKILVPLSSTRNLFPPMSFTPP